MGTGVAGEANAYFRMIRLAMKFGNTAPTTRMKGGYVCPNASRKGTNPGSMSWTIPLFGDCGLQDVVGNRGLRCPKSLDWEHETRAWRLNLARHRAPGPP